MRVSVVSACLVTHSRIKADFSFYDARDRVHLRSVFSLEDGVRPGFKSRRTQPFERLAAPGRMHVIVPLESRNFASAYLVLIATRLRAAEEVGDPSRRLPVIRLLSCNRVGDLITPV